MNGLKDTSILVVPSKVDRRARIGLNPVRPARAGSTSQRSDAMSRPNIEETYPKRLGSIFNYAAPKLRRVFEPCLDLQRNCSDKLQPDEQNLLEKDAAVELVGIMYLTGVHLEPRLWKDEAIHRPNDGLSDIAREWQLIQQSRLVHRGQPLAAIVNGLWPGLMAPDRINFHPVGGGHRVPMWPNSIFIFTACITHAAHILRLQANKPAPAVVPRPHARRNK